MASRKDELAFFVLKNRLPASESTNLLGRVILSFDDPMFDYTPESPSSTLTALKFSRFLLDPQYNDNARLTTQTTTTSNGCLEFLSLTSLSTSTTMAGTTIVTSPRITTCKLKHEADYFAALKAANPTVRRQLLEMCPINEKVYLVVGTMSARAARLEWTAQTKRSGGVSAKVPPLELVAPLATTGVPLLGLAGNGVLTAEAGFEKWSQAYTTTGFEWFDDGKGEQVFAIACRVVKRTWRGFGGNVQVGMRQPEYNGGQHFGQDSESETESDSDCEDGEEDEVALAEELELGDLVGM